MYSLLVQFYITLKVGKSYLEMLSVMIVIVGMLVAATLEKRKVFKNYVILRKLNEDGSRFISVAGK